jgi:nucleoside diphosphate kinase
MKHVQLFEQFVNEKVYRMTGIYSSKGLVGKVMQAFKQEISKIKYEGDQKATLAEVNKAWAKFQKDAEKIILDAVEKGAKSMDSVLFVTANLGKGFHIDEINKLNSEGSDELFVGYELVINVGFMDDVNGQKLYKKIDKTGMMNSPVASKKDTIYGDYDSSVGNNNLEIRDNEFMSIDAK